MEKLLKFIKASLVGFSLLGMVACGDSDSEKTSGGATEETQGIAINDKTVAGVSQKGPFVNGSSVHLYGLDFETLTQSGSVFTGKITSDKGDFKVSGVSLASQYALLEASGYYHNEVTGEKSSSPITLYAITDLSDRDHVNINLLTHLEYERVQYLVSTGMSVQDAKKQTEREILKTFYIDLNAESFEDLNIFNDGDGDAALLAVSILLQGNRSEADLSELLANYAMDIEKDGEWNDEKIKTEIADWTERLSRDDDYGGIRLNISKWKFGEVPAFEIYARRYWWFNYGLGLCTDGRQGEVLKNQNELSFNADIYYICDKQSWRIAKNIERDTYSWGDDFKEGTVKKGNVNPKLYYVYDGFAWREGTELDAQMYEKGGFACAERKNTAEGMVAVTGDTSSVKIEKLYYVCEDKWVVAPSVYNDTYESRGKCDESHVDDVIVGRIDRNNHYICTGNQWQEISTILYELIMTYGTCVNRKDGFLASGKFDGFGCKDNHWIKLDEFERDMGICTPSRNVKAVYEGHYYICQDSEWKAISEVEFEYGFCTTSIQDSMANVGWHYYVCQDSEWTAISEVEYKYGFCTASMQDSLANPGSFYVCKDLVWKKIEEDEYNKLAELKEIERKFGICTASIQGSVAGWGSFYVCQDSVWKEIEEDEYNKLAELEEIKRKYGICSASKQDFVVSGHYVSYICDNNEWRETTELIGRYGRCRDAIQDSVIFYEKKFFVCTAGSWEETSVATYVEGVCSAEREKDIIEIRKDYQDSYPDGEFNWRNYLDDVDYYVYVSYFLCEKGEWRKIEWKENSELSGRFGLCRDAIQDSVAGEDGRYYICDNNEWRETNGLIGRFGRCRDAIQDSVIFYDKKFFICAAGSWEETSVATYVEGVCSVEREGKSIEIQRARQHYVSDGEIVWHNYLDEEDEIYHDPCVGYFLCENEEWRKISLLEHKYGLCEDDREGKFVRHNNSYYACRRGVWTKASELDYSLYKTYGWCTEDRQYEIAEEAVCDSSSWRAMTDVEKEYGICSSKNEGAWAPLERIYVCYQEKWITAADWNISWNYYVEDEGRFGELVDARDGRVYKTIKIGDLVWMAENLDYFDSKNDNLSKTIRPSNYSGRLYSWSAAMNLKDIYNFSYYGKIESPHQGVCPKGWHIPSGDEWNALFNTVGNDALSLITSWGWPVKGSNESGFSAIPYGVSWCNSRSEESPGFWCGYFDDLGYQTLFWSSTEYENEDDIISEISEAYQWYIGILQRGSKADLGHNPKEHAFYVRCVQD
ncbi:MAG: hypothetical protein MJY98_01460 [Fibrobacter sp.]|nr:hypothetical protein [Fibrobacter sp.]